MDLLMSIHPIIARRITSGKKRYEYRRTIFKQEVNHIYLYASAPVRKIVCRFKYAGYLADSIDEIWEQTGKLSAASEAEYRDYFKGKKIAYAIRIEDLAVFEPPLDPWNPGDSLKNDSAFRPPQSFRYINDRDAFYSTSASDATLPSLV
jgi:predicted transcriptional regulator